MPMAVAVPRLLIKAKPGIAGATVSLGAAAPEFKVEPLFKSIGAGQGAAAPAVWHMLSAAGPVDGANPWDLCHQLLRQGLGFAGAPAPEIAEPDFQQRWPAATQRESGLALAAGCSASEPQDKRFPQEPDPMWFR